jgi:voltage-gated potassium channel
MVTAQSGRAVPGAPAAVSRRRLRRRALLAVVRVVVVTGTMVALYVSAPIDQRPVGSIAVRLILGMVLLVVVLAWQIWSVRRSPHPMLRGLEVVAVSAPLLILGFAAAYFAAAHSDAGSFTQGLTRLDAAYFSVTVLSTVGFGDIAPVSQLTRSIVMSQMLLDLIFVGLVLRVLMQAVRQRRDALREGDAPGELDAEG